jgi:hypothetical protein
VHVLDTELGWAYCLDLPAPFGTGPAAAMTIAVTPDGRRLLVADLAAGHLAVADTETLKACDALSVPAGSGIAYAVAPPNSERLYLGIGTDLTVVDTGLLAVVGRRVTPEPIRGLAVGDGRLFVGYANAVGWYSLDGIAPQGRLPVAGLAEVRRAV